MDIFDGFLLEAVCLLESLQNLLEFRFLVDDFLDSLHLFEEDVSDFLVFVFGELEYLQFFVVVSLLFKEFLLFQLDLFVINVVCVRRSLQFCDFDERIPLYSFLSNWSKVLKLQFY